MRKLRVNRKKWYRYLKANPIVIREGWYEDLIWCPSQCYLVINFEGKDYVVYLRWRWDDPWTVDLIPLKIEGGFAMWLYYGSSDEEWLHLNVPFYKDSDLIPLKGAAFQAAAEFLRNNSHHPWQS